MTDPLTLVLAACGLLAIALTLRLVAALLLAPTHPLARAFDWFDEGLGRVRADDRVIHHDHGSGGSTGCGDRGD